MVFEYIHPQSLIWWFKDFTVLSHLPSSLTLTLWSIHIYQTHKDWNITFNVNLRNNNTLDLKIQHTETYSLNLTQVYQYSMSAFIIWIVSVRVWTSDVYHRSGIEYFYVIRVVETLRISVITERGNINHQTTWTGRVN